MHRKDLDEIRPVIEHREKTMAKLGCIRVKGDVVVCGSPRT